MDSVRRNIGMVFKAQLDSETVEPFLSLVSKSTRTMDGTFCRIQQDLIEVGILPADSIRLIVSVQNCTQSLEKITEVNKNNVYKTFMKTRELLLIQVSMEIYVVKSSDVFIILNNRVSRMTLNGEMKVRHLYKETVMSVLMFFRKEYECIPNGGLRDRNTYNANTTVIKSSISRTNKNILVQRVQIAYSTEKFEAPRRESTITAVQPEMNQVCVMAYPLDHTEYTNSEIPSYDDEFRMPVQATDADIGELSLSESPSVRAPYLHSSTTFSGTPRNQSYNDNVVVSGAAFKPPEKPVKYPDFASYQQRLDTFFNGQWSSNKPQPTDLADLGLFLKEGEGDLTRCFHCGIGFKDWSEADDPLNERVKHSPNCPFLIQKIGKDRIEALKQSLNNHVSTGGGAQGPHYMKSPRYQTMTARLQSFQGFPRSVNITPKQFAVAGLFYTGDGDLCRCFTCDGGLKTWDIHDDPIREHALYFPDCSYIKNLKGPNYIRRIQAERLNQTTEGYNNDATSGAHTKDAVSGAGAIAGHATTAGSQVPSAYSDPEVTSNTHEYSEHTIYQLSQKLGFSESEVITAKVELEIKGNREPTMSDIMNMLLDMKEEEERQEEQRKSDAEKGDVTTSTSVQAVRSLRWQFAQTGSARDLPRSGRPRVTTRAQDCYIMNQHLRNRFLTATATAAVTPGTRNNRISSQTVRNSLADNGLHGCRPYVGSVLTRCPM